MKIYLLAVTKAFDKFCIAGMTEDGKWIRPIPNNSKTRFWEQNQISLTNYGVLRPGDIIEISGYNPKNFQYPNHTEDFVVKGNMNFLGRLSNNEFLNFLKDKVEPISSFEDTVNAKNRSLCLINVEKVNLHITNYNGTDFKPKATPFKSQYNVENPRTQRGNYIVKDCKWSTLILNQDPNIDIAFSEIYFVIGLATPTNYDNVEYPQLIGLHTFPEVHYPLTYPH